MIGLAKQNLYTVEDIYNLPEGKRAELIDGEMFMMAPPDFRQQEILSELQYLIRDYVKKKNGSCKVIPAPFAVFLNADGKNYVEPDISVICDKSKIDEKGCIGAPDWVIEIVSPGTLRMDYGIKLFKYRSFGVREYWIVDPAKKQIFVYDFLQDSMVDYTFSDTVKAGIFPDLEIDFSKI